MTLADFKSYEEKLWNLPVPRRVSFISQNPPDGQSTTNRNLTDEFDVFRKIKSIAKAVKLIVESDEDVHLVTDRWPPISGRRGSRVVRVPDLSSALASRLIEALCLDPGEIRRLLPGHHYNPYLELMCKAIEKFPDVIDCLPIRQTFMNDEAIRFVCRLNEVVSFLRVEGRGRKVLRALDGWRRRMRARAASSRQYIDQIFALYPDVFAIHLDLAYCMQAAGDAKTWKSPVSLAQAKAHLAKFDRFVRDHYPVVGHLYWREYGLESGYQFRVLYFVNCLVKKTDDRVMPLLEEHWRKVITQGWGRHYNSRSARYRRVDVSQLRMYDVRESERRGLMTEVERHITQADFWAFHKEGGKCFGRGQELVALLEAARGGARRV